MITSLTNSQDEIGWWIDSGNGGLSCNDQEMFGDISNIPTPLCVIKKGDSFVFGKDGSFAAYRENDVPGNGALPVTGYIPPVRMENLGDNSFCRTYGLRYPLVAGAMANGICSTDIVRSMGKNGMLGFFGAAGLMLDKIEFAVNLLKQSDEDIPFGFNLIHSPNEPDYEMAVVNLYLQHKVRLVEASAFLGLTLPVVKYRVSGIYQDDNGNIITPNKIIAKVSRFEVASKFFAPPPDKFLMELATQGTITQEQAELASKVPMAQDVTAEADSGGHTDNRPAITLLPTLLALRDQLQVKYGYEQQLRVGAAGGISTPAAAAAMFLMGAAYVVTGSINQSCMEAGTSDVVREMLAGTQQADVAMAPAADMFEMGVKVQVLKRGTMFAMRAAKLYDLYCKYDGLDSLPLNERSILEKNFFRDPLDNVWKNTCEYFAIHDPRQVDKGETDPKHKMALIFRRYLGQSSRWANSGEPSRKIDYQIWCGPSMGAFNEWVKGTHLDNFRNRYVADVSLNILFGAAVNMRLNFLRSQGFIFPADMFRVIPLELSKINEITSR